MGWGQAGFGRVGWSGGRVGWAGRLGGSGRWVGWVVGVGGAGCVRITSGLFSSTYMLHDIVSVLVLYEIINIYLGLDGVR